MKMLFLGHAHTNGCRTAYFFPLLRERGADPSYVDVPGRREREAFLRQLPACEVMLVQRLMLSDEELRTARTKAQRLVYDVDDPVMYHSSRHWIRFSWTRREGFRRMAVASDFVLAASPLIADRARRHLPEDRIAIVPSTVDANAYFPPATPRPDGPPLLGWLGSAGTVEYLARLRHVVAELGRVCPDARLKMVSNAFCDLEGMPVEMKTWTKEEEVADFQSFDIGLLPLSRDLWTEGKGNGKLFQYLAVGLPVVATPVGIVEEVIEHGKTGFLARNRREWVHYLRILCSDPGLRRRMGADARRAFEKRFSLQAVFPTFWKGLTGR